MANVIKSVHVELGNAFDLDPSIHVPKIDLSAESSTEEPEEVGFARQLLLEARQEAENMRSEARIERAEMLREIEEQRAEALREAQQTGQEQGYADGYADGYEKGYTEAREANRTMAEALKMAFSDLEDEWNAHLTQNIDDLKYLALEVAEKIIGQEIRQNRDIYTSLVERALDSFRNYNWVDIYFSDQDAPLAAHVEKNLAEKIAQGNKFLKVRLSKELPQSSCIVETNAGVVDVGVPVQLEQVKEYFRTGE